MAQEQFQEKTEAPSPRKRQKSREKGQVAKSVEVNSVAVLGAALLAFWFAGEAMLAHSGALMSHFLHHVADIDAWDMANREAVIGGSLAVGAILAPLMGMVAIAGILANVSQVGFVLSTEAIQPKIEKISPLKGAKRLFSKRSAMELFKSIVKLGIVGVIGAWTMTERIGAFSALAGSGLDTTLTFVGGLLFTLAARVTAALVILAAIDFAYQRWQLSEDLKMTRQEVKDEHKETDGDPLLKARVRRIQQQMARTRMMQAVPTADVVVTNPTHYAVALKYEGEDQPAPQVVAKGADLLALEIRRIASENGVPVIEEPPTARALYSATEPGDFIPPELYAAVAELLALVYRRRRARA